MVQKSGLGSVEKRTFLSIPKLELRPFSCPARSQSLYLLCYRGSLYVTYSQSKIDIQSLTDNPKSCSPGPSKSVSHKSISAAVLLIARGSCTIHCVSSFLYAGETCVAQMALAIVTTSA
jgi:hypothetical protein